MGGGPAVSRLPAGLSFVGVGDVFLDEQSGLWPFVRVEALFAGRDIRFCNVEAPLTARTEPLPGRRITLRSDPCVAPLLTDNGFNLVSIAHNHAMDFGAEALLETMAVLRDAGIAAAGGGENESQARAPALLERGGLRVGLLAY